MGVKNAPSPRPPSPERAGKHLKAEVAESRAAALAAKEATANFVEQMRELTQEIAICGCKT